MRKIAYCARVEGLEGRRLCAVESTAGAVANYGAALGAAVNDVAAWADDAIDNTIHYPSPFADPWADPNPGAPTADPTTRGPGAGGADLGGLDDAALDDLYRAGGPLPFFALPYPLPGDPGDGFGGDSVGPD